MELPVYNMAGEVVGQTELDERVFGQPMNEGLVHQAIVHYLANQRTGTASTKTRSQVAGGGKKPYRQKGTGRARQGSTRAPQFKGGGVAFGPHPRDFHQLMPQKMRRLALRVALSERLREGNVRLVDTLTFPQPKVKLAEQLLGALNLTDGALLVTPEVDHTIYLSARNLPRTDTTFVGQLNIYDVVGHAAVVMPLEAVRRIEERLRPA